MKSTNYREHEDNKAKYIKDVNDKHQEILLAQMADKEAKKNRKKMNTLELLYNKALIKEAGEDNTNVKKANMWDTDTDDINNPILLLYVSLNNLILLYTPP